MKLSRNSRAFLLLGFDQLVAHARKRILCLFALSDVGPYGKTAVLAIDLDQFRRTESCPNLTILSANPDLQILRAPLGEKPFQESQPMFGMYPKFDVRL